MNRKIFLYTSVEITKAKLLSENLKSEEEEGEKRGKRKIVVALAMPIFARCEIAVLHFSSRLLQCNFTLRKMKIENN